MLLCFAISGTHNITTLHQKYNLVSEWWASQNSKAVWITT